MGKASRAKRERHEADAGRGDLPKIDVPHERRSLPVFWIVVALMVVGGLVAVVVTAPDDATKSRVDAAKDTPTYADVEVTGAALPTWDGTGTDTGLGDAVPTISGTNFDGEKTTIQSGGGTARVYITMAHWCPHCQAEIPRIVEWTNENPLPNGVEIIGVSTSADKGQTNFPPAEWLAREDWKFETIVDDELGTAAEAFGVSGFPYLVFTDADGNVVKRFSGEMEMRDFADAIDEIAPAADEPATQG